VRSPGAKCELTKGLLSIILELVTKNIKETTNQGQNGPNYHVFFLLISYSV